MARSPIAASSSPSSMPVPRPTCSPSANRTTKELKLTEQPNVVLIHGAFADGSCWGAVIEGLQAKSYEVTAPQLPHTSLADDIARLRQALARQSAPTILVGHSYG